MNHTKIIGKRIIEHYLDAALFLNGIPSPALTDNEPLPNESPVVFENLTQANQYKNTGTLFKLLSKAQAAERSAFASFMGKLEPVILELIPPGTWLRYVLPESRERTWMQNDTSPGAEVFIGHKTAGGASRIVLVFDNETRPNLV